MTAAEDGERDDGDGADHPPALDRQRPRRWRVAALVVLVAMGAAVVALAVIQTLRVADLSGDRDDLRDARAVRAAAGAFAEAFYTYDFDDVEGSARRIVDLGTERFARGFEETQLPGLQELFGNVRSTTEATTTEVFLGDVGESTAQALVMVDVVATNEATGTQVLTDFAFMIDLTREGGQWLVDAAAPAPRPNLTEVGGDG